MQKNSLKELFRSDEITQKGWNNLGNSLKNQGQLGNAITAYKMALSADSKFVPALTNIGLAFAENQQFEFENALASALDQKLTILDVSITWGWYC